MGDKRRLASIAIVVGAACLASRVPDLMTTSQALVVVTPPSHNFGVIEIGGSATTTITITPASGNDDDTVTQILETCSAYSLSFPSGPPPVRIYNVCGSSDPGFVAGDGVGTANCTPISYSFDVTFTPNLPGSLPCTVYIYYGSSVSGGSGSGSGSSGQGMYTMVSLSGTGMAPVSAFAVDPKDIAFGDIPTGGSSADQKITVTNTGSTTLTLTHDAPIDPAFNVSPQGATLAAGVKADFFANCAPASVGPRNDSITFHASPGNLAQSVTLSCNGIVSAVTVTPRPVSFEATLVGLPPPDVKVTITNPAAAGTVTINDITIDAPEVTIEAMPPDDTVLDAGASADLVLGYSALTPREGALGTLQLVIDGQAQSIAINGEARVGALETNPTTAEFGAVCAGTAETRKVGVYASDAGAVDVTSITPPPTVFDVSSLTTTLLPRRGNEPEVTVTLPAETMPGTYDGAFTINTNIPDKPVHDVPVHAHVLPEGISPTPNIVHFGVVMVGTSAFAQEVTLTNCNDSPISIAGAVIQGPAAADFDIVSNPSAEVGPRESHMFLVQMEPTAEGLRSAQLLIEHSSGMAMVDLDGTGFGGSTTDRETYYACTAVRPGSLVPLAFVVLALRRRRRCR